MARKNKKAFELDVFSGRAGRANSAIFEILAQERHQTIKQILKKIIKYEGLEETYYASLTKRLHNLQKTGYIGEAKPAKEAPKGQKSYELRIKAYFAMFLKENSIQDILGQATDTQTAHILLALLSVLASKEES